MPREPKTRYIIRKGPWYCEFCCKWIHTEKAPMRDPEKCSGCKGNRVASKT